MDILAYDLKGMTLATGEGAALTQDQRHRGLQLIARQLKKYRLPGAGSLKEKHLEFLVSQWQAEGLATGTIKNRVAWIRWWGRKARKSSVIPARNSDLGIANRVTPTGNRADVTTGTALALLDERMQLVLRLQMAFGLRLEESLKFQPELACRDERSGAIALKDTWCKGKRARQVPIVHERQRELLDEVRSLVGHGSMIPEGMDYITYRRKVERVTGAAGIRNLHKHRHWYAQWRYRALTGRDVPARGGATYDNLSRADRAADYRARLQISREMGHDRLDVANRYLGSRFAAKGAAS